MPDPALQQTAAQLAFQAPHRIALLVFSFLLLALIIELVRRRQFKERYALLWLAVAVAGLVVGVFPGIVITASRVLHVQFLTTFFVMSFVFLLGLVLSFCVVISRLSERSRELAQEVALLEKRIADMERRDGSR